MFLYYQCLLLWGPGRSLPQNSSNTQCQQVQNASIELWLSHSYLLWNNHSTLGRQLIRVRANAEPEAHSRHACWAECMLTAVTPAIKTIHLSRRRGQRLIKADIVEETLPTKTWNADSHCSRQPLSSPVAPWFTGQSNFERLFCMFHIT